MRNTVRMTVPPLLPPAAMLAAGILTARWSGFFPYTTAVLCLAACAGMLFARRLSAAARITACAFFVFGFTAYYLYGPGAPSYVSELTSRGRVHLEGVVERPPQDRQGQTVVYLRPLNVPPGFRRAGIVRLTVRGSCLNIRYGDLLTGELALKEPAGLRNPGCFDWGAYAKLNGIDAVASAGPGELHRAGNAAGAVMGRVYSFRRSLIGKAATSLDGPAEAIFRAIILGDQGAVTMRMRDAFAASGTTHILSVSGSHIALLAGVVFFVVWALFRLLPAAWALRLSMRVDINKLAAGAAIPATIMYCLIAGSEVATVRSVIMVCMFLASVIFDRQNQVLNTLSAAAIIVLLPDPAALFDVSFRLSYLAVLFIALALNALRDWRPPLMKGWPRTSGLARKAAVTFIISVAAIVGTAPLVAAQFNSFSYVALPANIALLPVAGAVAVPLGLASCALDALSSGAGLPLAGLNTISLDAFYSVVVWFSSMPHANLHPPSPGGLAAAAYYALLAWAMAWPAKPARKTAAALLAAGALAAGMFTHTGGGAMKVCYLDVGQGECAVVKLPEGGTMLIDCGGATFGAGPGRQAAAPYLWNAGIGEICYVIVSHPQPDHISGLEYILSVFRAGQLWEGGLISDRPRYVSLRRLADSRGTRRYVMPERGELVVEGVRVQSLHTAASPVADGGEDAGTRINNRSLVLRLVYGDVSFLFTGDIESAAQAAMLGADPPLPLGSTVLKAPHHGSAGACVPGFIKAVSPKLAVVSAGRDNRHGHPSPITVDTLRDCGAEVLCTSSDGAVTVSTDGKLLDVRTYVSESLSPAFGWKAERRNIAKLVRSMMGS